jgi:mono/diheme cytochrome c family protein
LTLILTLVGVVLAVVLAILATVLIPYDNHVIPPQGVGESAAPLKQVQQYDPRVVEQGRVYYAQLCLSCHGVRGDGMGEWSYRVTPRPRNLRLARTQQRSDQQLFEFISVGMKGTAMIGWQAQLSEAQRWQLVTYLRSLALPQIERGG